ncbi:MAG: hypothetical protein HQRvContig02_25 [Haloquadratum phage sp.]|nr:MAG: hypothetical protein HQRvContig02_25 [Haloquadratum phage sp.]
MSQFYPIPMGAVAGLAVGLILRDTTGLSQLAVGIVAVVAGALTGAAWLASSLPNGSMVVGDGADDDRAQIDAGPTRLIVSLAIALLVLVIVINEALSAPALAAGEVEQVCGLCHVDWQTHLTVFGIITANTIAAHWLLAGAPWEEEHEDE